ncbi:aminotransferase class IV [Fulvivirga sedimenti]|uniref:branched-chain-amino-acid transaminase n=1 Tax=Fulvivirga sedimenti TaxID=2879465 RepID=A0A9X1HP66_9BACT|nr:aminotransferase class IV [Fulvivirga sedimenti]MCA6074597.1 aminotransferase class IV [Fulvivirga sedimenti]MCA6075774.1 aminotransferase class IV [Fulvivirga sedimenti]MCA6076902.1 aminotransferase class IV [Fulvivirga sedimenti]
MKALFNNNLIDTPLPIMPENRAFQYGDGIFETIWFRNGKAPLLEFHKMRLQRAAQVLRLDISPNELRYLEANIETLSQLNFPEETQVTAKLMFWRHASDKPGYGADATTTDSLLTIRPFTEGNGLYSLGISKEIRICPYPWSFTKNMNALPYIMASIECQDRALDELILCNQKDEVAECISHNLFVLFDGTWITPPLSAGGVAGTMRSFILKNEDHWSVPVQEQSIKTSDLTNASAMLITRATGLVVIHEFEKAKIDTKPAEVFREEILTELHKKSPA